MCFGCRVELSRVGVFCEVFLNEIDFVLDIFLFFFFLF